MQVFKLFIFILTVFIGIMPAKSFAIGGEIYSESTYVPEYGILSDTQFRFIPYTYQTARFDLGAASQIQTITKDDQVKLYDKSLVMALAGVRWNLTPWLGLLAEYRTEDRSRYGVFAGNIWLYNIANSNLFSEFYGESLILPSFHHDPTSTLWLKQGVRFNPAMGCYLDPFIEAYLRRSPTPNLGRDTEQLRAGLRGIYFVNSWSFSLLAYESFPKDEKPHEEVLFVIGGQF